MDNSEYKMSSQYLDRVKKQSIKRNFKSVSSLSQIFQDVSIVNLNNSFELGENKQNKIKPIIKGQIYLDQISIENVQDTLVLTVSELNGSFFTGLMEIKFFLFEIINEEVNFLQNAIEGVIQDYRVSIEKTLDFQKEGFIQLKDLLTKQKQDFSKEGFILLMKFSKQKSAAQNSQQNQIVQQNSNQNNKKYNGLSQSFEFIQDSKNSQQQFTINQSYSNFNQGNNTIKTSSFGWTYVKIKKNQMTDQNQVNYSQICVYDLPLPIGKIKVNEIKGKKMEILFNLKIDFLLKSQEQKNKLDSILKQQVPETQMQQKINKQYIENRTLKEKSQELKETEQQLKIPEIQIKLFEMKDYTFSDFLKIKCYFMVQNTINDEIQQISSFEIQEMIKVSSKNVPIEQIFPLKVSNQNFSQIQKNVDLSFIIIQLYYTKDLLNFVETGFSVIPIYSAQLFQNQYTMPEINYKQSETFVHEGKFYKKFIQNKFYDKPSTNKNVISYEIINPSNLKLDHIELTSKTTRFIKLKE